MNEKPDMVISFSGGQTSGFMSKMIKDKYQKTHNLHFVFSNTGEENEETLIFVDQCDKYFGLGVIWLEAVVNPEPGIGTRHKVVSFETASRNGEPFEAVIAKEGIPNAAYPKCSDRLKAMVIEDWKKSNGLKGCQHAIGIRKDEERRKSGQAKNFNLIYPLCDEWTTDKQDVSDFWENQPFRLELEDHEGNCKTCWKKSNPKLWLIAIESPERFDFFRRMESKYRQVKPNTQIKEDLFGEVMPQDRVFFRGHRSADDILREASGMDAATLRKQIGYDNPNDGCGSSCNAYTAELDLFND